VAQATRQAHKSMLCLPYAPCGMPVVGISALVRWKGCPGSLLLTACAVRVSCAAMLRASMVWLATAKLSARRLEASHSWNDTCRQHNRCTAYVTYRTWQQRDGTLLQRWYADQAAPDASR
jgi:hypothetical protein